MRECGKEVCQQRRQARRPARSAIPFHEVPGFVFRTANQNEMGQPSTPAREGAEEKNENQPVSCCRSFSSSYFHSQFVERAIHSARRPVERKFAGYQWRRRGRRSGDSAVSRRFAGAFVEIGQHHLRPILTHASLSEISLSVSPPAIRHPRI